MTIRKLLADAFNRIEVTLNNYRNYTEMHFIEHLSKHFEFLSTIDQFLVTELNQNETLLIEEYKFLVMKAVRNIFQPITLTKSKPRMRWSKRCFGYLLTCLGPLCAGLAGYLGCTSIIDLFWDIQHPIAIGIAVFFGIIEGFIFIGSDVRQIAKAAGVSFFKTKPLLELYDKQLQTIKNVHTHLLAQTCVNAMSSKQYTHCVRLVKQFNQDVQNKHKKLKRCYQASKFKQIIKKTVRGIEATLSLGTGVVTGKFIIGCLGAALTTSPVGWMLCAITGLFFFASYYYLRDKKIGGFVDGIIGHPKKLMCEQAKFIEDEEGVQKFESQTGLILGQKKTQEFEKQLLYNKINTLQKQIMKPSRLNNHLFATKNQKSSDLLAFPTKRCRSHC